MNEQTIQKKLSERPWKNAIHEHQNDVNAMQGTQTKQNEKKKHFILLGGLNLITEKVCALKIVKRNEHSAE